MDFSSLLSLVRCVFSRFTDGALNVLSAAHKEAAARDNEHVTPEHVLLTIAKAQRGFGLAVLKQLGLNLPQKIAEIEALVTEGTPKQDGSRCPSFSQETELLLAEAKSESKMLGHDYVGTEHLVLALLKCRGPASEYLKAIGLTAEQVRDEVSEILAG